VAIRSIKGNIDKAKKSMKGKHKFDAADKAANKLTPRELEIYEKGMADRTDAMFDRFEANKKGPRKRKPKTGPMREGKMYGGEMKKKKGMMGGGKAYTSMNKRYANGGKIYPSKGKS
jgi:hypothetical protein